MFSATSTAKWPIGNPFFEFVSQTKDTAWVVFCKVLIGPLIYSGARTFEFYAALSYSNY